MQTTGADIVFSRLPEESAGLSFSLPSGVRTKTKRPGIPLALVGPHFSRSYSSCNVASGTGRSCHLFWVRALRKSWSRTRASSVGAPEGRSGAARGASAAAPSSGFHLLHGHDLRHVMAQHVLDAVLQRGARGRAAGAGALEVQAHHAVAEAAKHDVAAVAGHRRADARVEQVLDLVHDLGVGGVEVVLAALVGAAGGLALQHGQARHEVVHEDRKSTRLNSSHANISYAVFCLKKKKNQFPLRQPGNKAAHHVYKPSSRGRTRSWASIICLVAASN